jgi:hypothetical protein
MAVSAVRRIDSTGMVMAAMVMATAASARPAEMR